MFTGIVQATVVAKSVNNKAGLKSFTIDVPNAENRPPEIGASIALDGVCLTVTKIDASAVTFDVIEQTLQVTSLSQVKDGYLLNMERSARYGDEVGGHVVSGHIDATASVVDIEISENNKTVWYQTKPELHKYIFEKGFIALNGCSLTVAKVDDKHRFAVCYIPETLAKTTHGQKQLGDQINLEVDRQTQAVVDTVERTLAAKGH